MNEFLRQKILKVVQDKPELPPLAYEVYKLQYRELAFNFLISNKFVGDKLLSIYRDDFNYSIYKTLSWIAKNVRKDRSHDLNVYKDFI